MRSPGTAVPRKTRCVSIPLCADPIVGTAPKNTVRASRLVSERDPNCARSLSIFAGSDCRPSTSVSMTVFHESCRYCEISEFTDDTASGSDPGMISGPESSPTHRAWTTAFISRSTPRVRWKRSRLDQSSYSRSNSSGWIG